MKDNKWKSQWLNSCQAYLLVLQIFINVTIAMTRLTFLILITRRAKKNVQVTYTSNRFL